ncbi:MAG: hypothetical protein WCE61_11600 [Candidatus Acidiferrum sp.]
MANSPKPTASVSAAGVVAILGSVLVLVGATLGLLALLLVKMPANMPEQPPFIRLASIGTMALGVVGAIFGIATGVGLFRLRNWARTSALVWAGICFSFGLIGIPLALFMTLPTPATAPGMPSNFATIFRLVLVAIYTAPLAVGIWWLALFSRKAVKDQFARTVVPVDFSQSQKPRPPVPITVLAWFFITSAANILIVPILPSRFPMMLFGHLFYPPAGTIIFVLSCALVTVAGIGLLKLKPWSYTLTIALQLLWLASGIISLLNPNFDSWMNSLVESMTNAMRMPGGVSVPMNFLQDFRWFMYIGLLIPLVIVAILFYYRERFSEAAAAADA